MDLHLTEIRNAHLFMEYLMSSGIKSPRSRSEDWELVDKEQVIARIKKRSYWYCEVLYLCSHAGT